MQDNSVDCILDIFSPANYKEFLRILISSGDIIMVVSTAGHLNEICEKVKDSLKNKAYIEWSDITQLTVEAEILIGTRQNFKIMSHSSKSI